MTREMHDRAVQSLNAALVEQDRLSERYDAASGTSTELGAYVRLRAAGDQVAARGAWLSWIDDEGYRGLNAGPFELRLDRPRQDRKSTRLNSSHRCISYAVFCLKKKKID